MEGVSYSLTDCFDILREMGIPTGDMAACGGGGTSSLWRQMLADLFGCPVKTIASKEGPALGAAILAGVGTGLFTSVEAACEQFIHTDRLCQPIPENHQTYRKYHALYQQLYRDLREDYQALAQL